MRINWGVSAQATRRQNAKNATICHRLAIDRLCNTASIHSLGVEGRKIERSLVGLSLGHAIRHGLP